jgi:hypothetical protein
MRINNSCRLAILILCCSACAPNPQARVSLVFEPDLSQSIQASARGLCLRQIESASQELSRGDSFAVIAVTDDTALSASGETLRYRFSDERQAFDDDLKQIVASEQAGLIRMVARKPYRHTDLVGTLTLAGEELANEPAPRVKAIAVLSDFIEDRGPVDFTRDRHLRNPHAAREFAARFPPLPTNLRGVKIFLGELPSSSAGRMPESRREAIRTFWVEFLTRQGAHVEWATDGLGELAGFVSRLRPGPDRPASVASILGPDAVSGSESVQEEANGGHS